MTTSQQNHVEIGIARIYVKDLSYECPKAPQVFQQQNQPEIKVEVNVQPKNLGNNLFEVSLNILLNAKAQDDSVFVIEIEQAGIFEIRNASSDQLDHILLVFCPQTLLPYARANIDHALTMGSLPPIMLAPINFEAMRAQKAQAN